MSQTKALNKLLSDIPFFHEREGQHVLQVVLVIPAVRAALQKVKVQGLPREQRHFVLISTLIAALEKLPQRGNGADWGALLSFLQQKKMIYGEEASSRFDRDLAEREGAGKSAGEEEYLVSLFPELSTQFSRLADPNEGSGVLPTKISATEACESEFALSGPKKRGRPRLSDSEQLQVVTVQIPRNIKLAIDVAANKEGVSSSALIRRAISDYLRSIE